MRKIISRCVIGFVCGSWLVFAPAVAGQEAGAVGKLVGLIKHDRGVVFCVDGSGSMITVFDAIRKLVAQTVNGLRPEQ